MDQELLIIELLSAAEPIYVQAQKNRHRNLIFAFLYSVAVCVLFFGIGSFVYQRLKWREGITDNIYLLERLAVVGILIAALVVLFLSVNAIQGIILRRSFQRFLVRCVQKAEKYPIVFQDEDSYYLADQAEKKKIRLLKEECIELLTTLDDATVYLGNRQVFFGFSSLQLFVLTEEPTSITMPAPKSSKSNRKWLILFLCLALGLAGIFANRHQNNSSEETISTITSNEVPLSSDDLLTQQGDAPSRPANQTNKLELNTETNELYMTTDSGTSWSFVPLKPEWLRSGSYLLTSGEIPMGYWMDKTYDVSQDFSWFIYSENEKDLNFLFSQDNGKTWQKSLVSENAQWIRYRKAQFFADGSGVLIYSNASPEVSSEGLEIYQTNDHGKTWSRSNGTTISQPVQNVSFVNPTLDFVSTREKLYYTNNSGSSFKEAVVTIPADYQTGGLDLFQSPNEVTQVSANQLETKLYLLKMSGIDQGKMFACLYRSSDNGETWQFAEQLSEVKATE